jgi:hypothetical protein
MGLKYFCHSCGKPPLEEDVKEIDGKLIHNVDYCGKEVNDLNEPITDEQQEEDRKKAIERASHELIKRNAKH